MRCANGLLQRKDAKTQRIGLVYASGGFAFYVVWACLGLVANHREHGEHRVFMVTPPAAV